MKNPTHIVTVKGDQQTKATPTDCPYSNDIILFSFRDVNSIETDGLRIDVWYLPT